MKKKVLFLTITLLFGSMLLMISNAQGNETSYQPFVVYEDNVKPAMVETYIKAAKKYVNFFAEHEFPYSMNVYATDDFHFYMSSPVKDFADIGEYYKLFNEAINKDPEGWDRIWEGFTGTYEFNRAQILVYSGSLSYVPENPLVDSKDANFLLFNYGYVEVGKSDEFREVFKKWVDLYKKNDIGMGFNTFMGFFGTDQPMYIWTTEAKNPTDFYTKMKEVNEKLGDESNKLWMETMKTLRKYEAKKGWYRADLSYNPEKE